MSGAFEEQFATAETASPLHNVEAEIGFLGDLLANNRLIDEVADRCRPADFSVPLYGRIYGKMIEQSASGSVDVVTLAPHFAEDGDWPRAYSVLAAANLNAGPKARTKAYFDQITMLSSRRRMVAGLKDVVASARNLSVTREDLVADADEAVAELAEQVVTAQASVGEYAQAVIDSFGKPIIGVRCGTINSLDGAIGVLRPSNLVVVGGRPGMGKTSLVTSYSIGAASMGHGVLIFSLEMSADELTRRMLADMTFSTRGGVPYEHVRDGTVRPHEMDAVLSAKTRFDELPIEINETSGLTLAKLIRQARSHKRRLAAKGEKLELVVVDYLQLMAHSRKGMSPYEHASEVSVGLKQFAKSEGLVVMAVAQLSRDVEKRPDKRPIWNECDDMGSFEWSPIKLKMRLLPADSVDAVALLDELAEARCIMPYEAGGKRYGAVRNFCQYQRPKKPNSTYPQTEAVRNWVNIEARSTRDGGELDTPSASPSGELTPSSTKASGELKPRKRGGSGEAVGNQLPTGGEKSRQRKEGGDSSVDKSTDAVASPIDPKKALFDAGVALLGEAGLSAKSARALIAKWFNTHGEEATNAALLSAAGRAEPVSWIEARLRTKVAAQDEAREASRSTAERYRRMAIPGPPVEPRKLEEHA